MEHLLDPRVTDDERGEIVSKRATHRLGGVARPDGRYVAPLIITINRLVTRVLCWA